MSTRIFNGGAPRLAMLLTILIVPLLAACGSGSTSETKSAGGRVSDPGASTTASTQAHAQPGKGRSTAPKGSSKAKAIPHRLPGGPLARGHGGAVNRYRQQLRAKLRATLEGSSKSPGGHGSLAALQSELRACLGRQGIALATGSRPPRGVSRARYQAAVKACVPKVKLPQISISPSKHRGSAAQFVRCMRKNGIDMPAPRTSANGPVVSLAGVDTRSKQFRSAFLKCSAYAPGLSGIGILPPAG